ncbi:MAG: polysaccharide biosynthesis tyrosine autokinase [Terracidiphilus sp.]
MKPEFAEISEPSQSDSDLATKPSAAPGAMLDEDPFGLFIRFLKKRGWILVVAAALGYLVAVVANHFLPKRYTAQANIEIQAEDATSQFRLEQVQDLGASADTSERLDTEIEILHSRNLALETIQALHLETDPDFLPLQNGRPWDLTRPDYRLMFIDVFQGDIAISRLGHTSILRILVTSRRPELSSLIANTLIDRYIEHSFRENYAATAKVSGWLDSKLSTLKENLEKSQQRIIELQRGIGIYGTDQSHSIIAANLEELNKQYADAQVDRMLKESRLQEIQSSPPDVIDAAVGTVDPSLQASKQRLLQLESDYNSLVQTYGSAYPRVKTLKAQIDQLQKLLSGQERAQIMRIQKELDASRSDEAKLRDALDKQEQEAFGMSQKAMQYELAHRDYEANRLLYDGLQQRLQEAGIISSLHSTAIHVVDSADTPVFPSYPRTNFNKAVGIGGGLFFGICLALLLEMMDINLKTMTDIEQGLQLPLIAAIPEVDSDHLQPGKFREFAVSRGISSWSKMAEALRGMRTSILLSSSGSPPKVVMLASTRPGEGKSSVASLTAITFALNGSKVLLVDADLRRPAIHLRFRIGKGLGLSSVLSGKAPFQEAVVVWPDLPNLHILPSGPIPPLPSELLGSKEMENLLAQVRKEYDFIIIDTPPVLAVTDASVLGRLTDGVILILRYGTARKQVVLRCIDLLERSGTHLLGVAVNAVDYTAPEYSEYYGRKYYEYYGERKPDE